MRAAERTPSVAAQLAGPVVDAADRVHVHGASRGDVRIVLQPEGLGRVHVAAKLVGGRVHVEIACDSDAGAVTVRATLDGLRDHLDAVTGAASQLVVLHRPVGPDAADGLTPSGVAMSTGSGGGAGSWSAPNDPAPGGGGAVPVARPEAAARDRELTPNGVPDGDDLDLLI